MPPRLRTPWISMNLNRSMSTSHGSLIRPILILLVFSVLGYLLLLPLYLFFGAFRGPVHRDHLLPLKHEEDALKHFIGSRDCGLTKADLYLAPIPSTPKTSPFCKNRETLLEAMSTGSRKGFNEPFVGKGCTYRWFSTTEICMIIERFNAIIFVGDDIAQSLYAAFNVLLREDLALGGLQQWIMSEQEQENCKCSKQFTNPGCLQYAIRAAENVKENSESGQKGGRYICDRIPHAYIPVNTIPASPSSQTHFQDLTYSKPNPWQPSPVIFSFSHSSSVNTTTTNLSLSEWSSIATQASRNIPMLFLGPPAFGPNKTQTTNDQSNDNLAVLKFQEEMTPIAREKHFDVLNLFGLTEKAGRVDGVRYGEGVAVVQAMMVVNWLAKLDSS